MLTNRGNDQGCGKWLTTKNTRRMAQSFKQKNFRGAKKGRKRPSAFKSDHVPGVVISSTPMSPRLVEMLSRVKQAKVERFFKPVGSKDKNHETGEVSRSNDGGFSKNQMLQSYTAPPVLRRQHKVTSDQEELPLWDDDDLPSNVRQPNETEKFDISGILPIETSDSGFHAGKDMGKGLQPYSIEETNPHEPSPTDETIRSPIPKRLRSMADESSINYPIQYDDDGKDSDSFHYTQWVHEQIKKSKQLQGDDISLDSSGSGHMRAQFLPSSGEISASFSVDFNRKYSQDKDNEMFSNTESQFRFTEWALEQKAKCKRLQNNDLFDAKVKLSGPSDEQDNVHSKLREFKSPSDLDWSDSNFQYTDWVREQKAKSKEIQYSLPETKGYFQTDDRLVDAISLKGSDVHIPESEVFEETNTGSQYRQQHENDEDSIKEKSESITANKKTEGLKNDSDAKPSRQAFKDVSNGIICNNETNLRLRRNSPSKMLRNETEKEGLDNATSPSQESELFQYTEWTKVQKQICKQIQQAPEAPSFQDVFWDVPSAKKDTKCRNECRTTEKQLILASDTDQESDSDICESLS